MRRATRAHQIRPPRVTGRRDWRAPLGIALALGLAGCSQQVIKHGHQFGESDVQQIQPGMSQDQVRLALGTPTTTASVGTGNAFYYISSTMKQTAFLAPSETDRQIVAVYMNQAGTVERVANYGLKDGKVFDYVSRTTPAPGARDEGLLKSLFRNLGRKQLFGE
jgi:outer membrane protein assembly factor BamE (lipoprotein component of BamABCDE complex)